MTDNKDDISSSLADRLTKADGSKFEAPKLDTEKPTSWADDMETPVKANPEPAVAATVEDDQSSLAKAQVDGATEPQRGSQLLGEPSYSVNVKLSDVQADPNNPLYSIKNFEDLGLFVNVYSLNY